VHEPDKHVLISGQSFTMRAGESVELLFSTGNPEAERLRDVLRSVRPKDGVHDFMCKDGGHGQDDQPDGWVEETWEPYDAGMRMVMWVAGEGFVDVEGPQELEQPYVGWCCDMARQRYEIDVALGVRAARSLKVPR
jgi:hypothetical protein